MNRFSWKLFGKLAAVFGVHPVAGRRYRLLQSCVFFASVLCQIFVIAEKLKCLILNELIFVCCTIYMAFTLLFMHVDNYRNAGHRGRIVLELKRLQAVVGFAEGQRVSVQGVFLVAISVYLAVVYGIFCDGLHFFLFTVGYTVPKLAIIAATLAFCNYANLLGEIFAKLNETMMRRSDPRQPIVLYTRLIALGHNLTRLHAKQLILSIGQCYILIIYEMYHLLLLVSQGRTATLDLIVFASSWASILLTTVILLVTSCSGAKGKADAFAPAWITFSITRKFSNTDHLGLKLLHEKLTFSPANAFDIGAAFLFMFIGACITYLVILTQFSKEL